MQLVVVDSYDSFTWNLVQSFQVLGAAVRVVTSDCADSFDAAREADLVVLGPGPGRPEDAGYLIELVRTLSGRVPLLGVCLGHQAIALAFGASVVRYHPVHGHATPILHDNTGLFQGLPQGVPMTRYHSLGVEPSTLPACLSPTAWAPDGVLMALTHRDLPIYGVQFHPESVLSGESGQRLLARFVGLDRTSRSPSDATGPHPALP